MDSTVVWYSVGYSVFILLFASLIHYTFPPDIYDKKLLWSSIPLTFFNIITLAFIDAFLSSYEVFNVHYQFLEYGMMHFIWTSVLYVFMADFLHWFQHYIFHIPYIYRKFHYIHHQYVHPTAFDFGATHPVETLTLYLLYRLPLVFFQPYIGTVYAYSFLSNIYSILYHGAGLKLLHPEPDFHNVHHKNYRFNFGGGLFTTFWDKLFGTYANLLTLPSNFIK